MLIRHSLLTGSMVDILVGPGRKTFNLHRDLLCDRSDYFKASLEGAFLESQTNELHLPDDSPAVFELFVNWLYGGSLKKATGTRQLRDHFGLLAFSEKLLIEDLQNATIDAIRSYYRATNSKVSAKDIQCVYEKLSNPHMRRLMASLAALQVWAAETATPTTDIADLLRKGGDFAVDYPTYLVMYSGKIKSKSRLVNILGKYSRCEYHSHRNTPKCGIVKSIKKPSTKKPST